MTLRHAYAAAILALTVSACRNEQPVDAPPPPGPAAEAAPETLATPAPPQAPDFTLAGPDGEFRLDQQRGRVVLITFWASWSEPSVAALDTAAVLAAELAGDDFVAVGVSQDEHGLAALTAWAADSVSGNRIAVTLLSDSAHVVARRYGDVEMLPTTVVIDREGRLRARHVGVLSSDALLDLVAPALIESAAGAASAGDLPKPGVRSIAPADVARMVASGAALLDVREVGAAGDARLLAHARHRPLPALEREDLPANLAAPIVFLGATLAEAQEAAARAARWGYRVVYTVVAPQTESGNRVIG
jgi:peroxiredoxin